MAMKKATFLCLAILGTYFFARGGIQPILSGTWNAWDYLAAPLVDGTPFDAAIVLVSILLFTWSYLLGDSKTTIPRSLILRGVALASALLAGTLVALDVTLAVSAAPEVTATIALVAVLHAVVGLGAALLLLCRRESRGGAVVPLFATLTMCATAGALFAGPLFS
ncbi:MAG: hypothetical protein L0Z55_09465 [Planctomycetes bacterium]|nr:hypothetical protein [Planctomycetota bacterium]